MYAPYFVTGYKTDNNSFLHIIMLGKQTGGLA